MRDPGSHLDDLGGYNHERYLLFLQSVQEGTACPTAEDEITWLSFITNLVESVLR